MLLRRTLFSIPPALLAARASAAVGFTATAADAASFRRYIDDVKQEGRRLGIPPAVLEAAFANVRLNSRVIELDRNQPEVQFTWARYRSLIASDQRIAAGRVQYATHADLLRRVEAAYGVPGPVIVGLWGLESDYGRDVGKFNVIESVATLAWEGRRRAYFHTQLIDCLKILATGDIEPQQMMGSWAGAMGQTQFMPDCFLQYAVDFDHRGKRDLWNDFACVFASTANNLQAAGWRRGMQWGWRVNLPPSLDTPLIGRTVRQPIAEWIRLGVRRQDGAALPATGGPAALIQPGAPADADTYLVQSTQFAALRAYNPSDKYAVCIGLLADGIAG
jgi:membrane-bound lytic murein transglycosylase B